jgi:excisionase family DNA binding protein
MELESPRKAATNRVTLRADYGPVTAVAYGSSGTDANPDKKPTMEKLLYTVDEARSLLGLGRSKMYDLLRSGELASIKVGRCRRIPGWVLIEFVNGMEPAEVEAS